MRDCTVDELEGHAVEGIYTAIRDCLVATAVAEGTPREGRATDDYDRVYRALIALQGQADARLTMMGAWRDVRADLGMADDDVEDIYAAIQATDE